MSSLDPTISVPSPTSCLRRVSTGTGTARTTSSTRSTLAHKPLTHYRSILSFCLNVFSCVAFLFARIFCLRNSFAFACTRTIQIPRRHSWIERRRGDERDFHVEKGKKNSRKKEGSRKRRNAHHEKRIDWTGIVVIDKAKRCMSITRSKTRISKAGVLSDYYSWDRSFAIGFFFTLRCWIVMK